VTGQRGDHVAERAEGPASASTSATLALASPRNASRLPFATRLAIGDATIKITPTPAHRARVWRTAANPATGTKPPLATPLAVPGSARQCQTFPGNP